MLLQPCLDRVEVGARVGEIRILVQHLPVRGDRFLILALLRQRVAEVVTRARVVALREGPGRVGVIARTILRRAAHARSRRQSPRPRGVAILQRMQGALVAIRPQRRPCRRMRDGHRRRHQAQREHQQPAAPERQRGQHGKDRQQPHATIPPQLRAFAATRASRSRNRRAQSGDAAALGVERNIAPTARQGDRAQRGIVAARHQHPTGPAREAAAVARYRRAGVGTDADHVHPDAACMRRARRIVRGGIGGVGDQHDLAALHVRLLQQLQALPDAGRGVIARHRHHVGPQRLQEIQHRALVVGQGRDNERRARIRDQRGARVARAVQQVAHRKARTRHAVGLEILRQHVAGQRQHHHPHRAIHVQRGCNLLPRGPRQCGYRERPRQGAQHEYEVPARTCVADEVRQQRRIRQPCQRGTSAATACQHPQRQRQRRERQPPPRAQEMQRELRRIHARANLPGRSARHGSKLHASSSASASGHGYSSRFGRSSDAPLANGSSASIAS